jgi:VCBS repeat-containing protein
VATVSITVVPVNDAPQAIDDSASTNEETAVIIGVLANDTDVEGNSLSVTAVTQGANGAVIINPDNSITYTPSLNFVGTDSFTYSVSDGNGGTDSATVNVTVANVNDTPTAGDDAATVVEDSVGNTINVLGNDSDIDRNPLSVASVTQGSHGAVTNNGTSVSYTPASNYFGPDAFTYTVSDGQGGSDTATVNVMVSNVNDAPLAVGEAYNTHANTALVVAAPGVLTNDVDIDSNALSAVLVTNVSNGTLTLNPDGSFTYSPTLNFFGLDSFTYRASDGLVTSNLVTVQITVVNNLIVFSTTRDGNSEIYVMGVDGTSQTRVTNDPAADAFPAWSPDRSKIAFISDRDGSFEVYVMNANGTSPVRLTTGGLVEGAIDWSPDGSRLAFTSNRDGNPEIYIMNVDGTGLTRLAKSRAIDMSPRWSPDGTRIAFASDRKRSFEIYVMNSDGTGLTRLTNNAFTSVGPAWSPDGTKIAFTTNRDGNFEIYVMNTDGSGPTRLTNNAATDEEPSWSSDGNKVIFTSLRDGNAEIYVMNADGTGQTRLTTDASADTSPR